MSNRIANVLAWIAEQFYELSLKLRPDDWFEDFLDLDLTVTTGEPTEGA